MENYQQEFPSNGLETKTNLSFISFLLSWFPCSPVRSGGLGIPGCLEPGLHKI